MFFQMALLLTVPRGGGGVNVSRGNGELLCYPLPADGTECSSCVSSAGGMGSELSLLSLVSFGDTRMYLYKKLVTESTVYYFHLVNNYNYIWISSYHFHIYLSDMGKMERDSHLHCSDRQVTQKLQRPS